jgi:acyl-CoA reductase-like NAD-dependent aldehyde dehydrogenase
VSFVAINLCVAPQRVIVAASVYFVIDSVRKLLDAPSYSSFIRPGDDMNMNQGNFNFRLVNMHKRESEVFMRELFNEGL